MFTDLKNSAISRKLRKELKKGFLKYNY